MIDERESLQPKQWATWVRAMELLEEAGDLSLTNAFSPQLIDMILEFEHKIEDLLTGPEPNDVDWWWFSKDSLSVEEDSPS